MQHGSDLVHHCVHQHGTRVQEADGAEQAGNRHQGLDAALMSSGGVGSTPACRNGKWSAAGLVQLEAVVSVFHLYAWQGRSVKVNVLSIGPNSSFLPQGTALRRLEPASGVRFSTCSREKPKLEEFPLHFSSVMFGAPASVVVQMLTPQITIELLSGHARHAGVASRTARLVQREAVAVLGACTHLAELLLH